MSDRPDGCYRWVILEAGDLPEVAMWDDGNSTWRAVGSEIYFGRAHKVGVGGTLDAPPDVWEDDLPEAPKRAWVQVEADPARWAWQTPTFGTDDPDARTMTERGLRPLTSEEAEASLGRPLR